MAAVAKKKPPPDPPIDDAQESSGSILVRLPDPALAEALAEHARRTRRSRNLAIVVILEDAMRAAGLWPWPPTPSEDE